MIRLVFAKASVSGRVRDAGAKQLLAKQLEGLSLPSFLDQASGQIKVKKPKKVKTPEEECIADVKKLSNKSFVYTERCVCFNCHGYQKSC